MNESTENEMTHLTSDMRFLVIDLGLHPKPDASEALILFIAETKTFCTWNTHLIVKENISEVNKKLSLLWLTIKLRVE